MQKQRQWRAKEELNPCEIDLVGVEVFVGVQLRAVNLPGRESERERDN